LDAEDVDALTPLLAQETATLDDCHYALWTGWGWLHPASMYVWSSDPSVAQEMVRAHNDAMAQLRPFVSECPVEPWWGGRDFILFDGAVHAVSAIRHSTYLGPEQRQCPQ
jgi:hypothetical protein